MRFLPAEILLPDFERVDPRKWSVIACDQFTSEPAYWEAVEREVGDAPSTLRLILPEAYLERPGLSARIEAVEAAMRRCERGVLRALPRGYIKVERTQSDGRVRRGIVGCIDLADYDYARGSAAPIRATEETVLSRIPPRAAVRRAATLELPHVMLLTAARDADLWQAAGEGTPLYDFDLMQGGGHLRGSFAAPDRQAAIEAALADAATGGMVLAVGDGNHSLASAKAIYEEIKRNDPKKAETSPARYALVEVVCLDSPALTFSPIYRLARGCDPAGLSRRFAAWAEAAAADPANAAFPALSVRLLSQAGEETVRAAHGAHPLAVGSVQMFLDALPAGTADVDYIHDEASLAGLAKQPGALGFVFEGMTKDELFPAVAAGGALPRKTFSMGHARDKRYYTEARRIR